MDGFHLDNMILDELGNRARKGAPETFDVGGFLRIIKAIKDDAHVYAPNFDRSRDLSLAAAISVPADVAVVIVEGNYLMFDADGWRDLAPLWDTTVRLGRAAARIAGAADPALAFAQPQPACCHPASRRQRHPECAGRR